MIYKSLQINDNSACHSQRHSDQIYFVFHRSAFITFSEDACNKVCSVFRPSQNLASFVIYDICRSSRIKVQLHLRLLSGHVPNAQPYGRLVTFSLRGLAL